MFNIGVYRRRLFGAHLSADWFDASNVAGFRQRNECALHALQDMFDFFRGGGQAAVFDGTNTTVERREMVRDSIAQHAAETGMVVELVWLESIVTDAAIVQENIRETKLSSPDYDHLDAQAATKDFLERIRNYEKHYEPLPAASDKPYVKLIDAGRQIITNRIQGYLMGKSDRRERGRETAAAATCSRAHCPCTPCLLCYRGQHAHGCCGRMRTPLLLAGCAS